MTKELSIENIKKELINKISNNSEILEYFENYLRDEKMDRCIKEYGMKFIKDNYIFPYDMSTSGYLNFIAIEVDESEVCMEKNYDVNIIVVLEDYKAIDKIAVLLGKIASELYPNRFNYRNTAYSMDYSYSQCNNKTLARAIQFTINNRQTYTD